MENANKIDEPKTAEGKAWLQAYLHPPTMPVNVQGIPDQSTLSSTTLTFRNEFSIDAPTTTTTWSCLIVSLPSPQYPLIVFKWAGDLPKSAGPADFNARFYKNPNFDFGVNAANYENNCSRYRMFASSTTVYFDAASLYNQGKCYVVQECSQNYATGGVITSNYNTLPFTASGILQMSDRYYTGMATEGSYSVEGFANPAQQYESSYPQPWGIVGEYMTMAGIAEERWWPADPAARVVIPWSGMTSGMHLYKGLLPQATLQVKRIYGLEVLPIPASAWAPFSSPGPCPDNVALESAAVSRHSMKDGMPAAANDFGHFLSTIKNTLGSFVQKVWPLAKPAVKMVVGGLPGGAWINQGIEGVETLLTTKSPQPKPRTSVPAPAPAPPPVQRKKKKRSQISARKASPSIERGRSRRRR